MKRGTLNLALLAVALALGLAVFFAREKEEKGPPLTPLAREAVTTIDIEHPGQDAIRLERADGRWQLVAPVQADTELVEVGALLELADRETRETLDATQVRLAELELDPPKYTIALNDVRIAFGTVEPLQYRRYVKVGETISLIDDPPSAALDKNYADLVAKKLLPEGAKLARLELPKLTLSREKDRPWMLTPKDPKAGADQLEQLAAGWLAAGAMWNEQARDRKPKGDKVKITLEDGAVLQYVIVERDPQFKLHRADVGVTYVLSKALTESLLKLPDPPKPDEPAEPAPLPKPES